MNSQKIFKSIDRGETWEQMSGFPSLGGNNFMALGIDQNNVIYASTNNDGIYIVPAFTGLGAPYWNPDAKGIITGLTRNTDWKNLVRAVIESVAYQTYDLFEAMKNDGLKPLIIQKVESSCGCTEPEYSKAPVRPMSGSEIKATFDAKKTGVFSKSITVTTNASENTIISNVTQNTNTRFFDVVGTTVYYYIENYNTNSKIIYSKTGSAAAVEVFNISNNE